MLELFGRWRAWVLRLLGVVSKRDLLALETRLDTLIGEFDRQTARLDARQPSVWPRRPASSNTYAAGSAPAAG